MPVHHPRTSPESRKAIVADGRPGAGSVFRPGVLAAGTDLTAPMRAWTDLVQTLAAAANMPPPGDSPRS